MIAACFVAGLVLARHGGLLTGVGYQSCEKRLGWTLAAMGVVCGYIAGRL